MSDIAIRVEEMSKVFRIGLKERRRETLLGALAGLISFPLENYRSLRRLTRFDELGTDGSADSEAVDSGQSDVVWALRDVSFHVRHGEVVGIIGSNGAGKSTLLKILSRITEPTRGRALLAGRVGSLLEVGTGFHPDLTGRENLYLNGTILGMRKREIDSKFDEIVGFSGVERFIDTPVKRYSSGMRVRLAFAVAAHLDPEILIVDEVLTVGDIDFQRKCLGKMNDVASQGRTVLFVSHNLAAVKDLCHTALLLNFGEVIHRGDVLEGIVRYSKILEDTAETAPRDDTGWRNVRLVNEAGQSTNRFDNSEPITLEARLNVAESIDSASLICVVDGSDGLSLVEDRAFARPSTCLTEPGSYRVQFKLPPLWIAPDAYSIQLRLFGWTAAGRRVREIAPRLLLDITDQYHASVFRTKAKLAPQAKWTLDLTKHSSVQTECGSAWSAGT